MEGFILEKWKKEFSKKESCYKNLLFEAENKLQSALKEERIKIQTVTSRVKSLDSFIQKASERRTQNYNPFEDIKDIVGLRVVCLFLSDIERIEQVIKKNFELINEDNKISNPINLSTFGYMSAHYIVKAKETVSNCKSNIDIPFEIQVRTISMDAWANISHFIDYKTENSIPTGLKRELNALSALFFVADNQFEKFYKHKQSSAQNIEEKVNKFIDKQSERNVALEVNFESLNAYLNKKFPNRKRASNHYISDLITLLVNNSYKTIESIDEAIEEGLEKFAKFESQFFRLENRTSKEEDLFYREAVVKYTLAILNEDFRKVTNFEDYDFDNC